jgi:hypothetical protein
MGAAGGIASGIAGGGTIAGKKSIGKLFEIFIHHN